MYVLFSEKGKEPKDKKAEKEKDKKAESKCVWCSLRIAPSGWSNVSGLLLGIGD